MKDYVKANGLRLGAALALVLALMFGLIDPAAAALGGFVICDTSPDELFRKVLGEHAAAIKDFTSRTSAEVLALRTQIVDLAQKMSTGYVPGSGGRVLGGARELAELIVQSEGVKQFLAGNTRVCEVQVPTRLLLKTQIVSETGTGQALVAGDRRPGAVTPPQQRLLVQGLFERVPTTSNLIEFASEASFTNNARPQGDTSPVGGGEGEEFAESAFSFTLNTAAVRTIGHWIPASMQVLRDSAFLEEHLIRRLLYGVNLKIENDILTGTGAANTLNGINNQAAAYSRGATNDTAITTMGKSILQLELSDFAANGCILHPVDWWDMRLLRDSQNRYILGDPASAGPSTIWGVNVVPTSSQTQGKFTTIDAPEWGVICDNEVSTIRISDSHSDFFVRGLVAIRAHARLAFVSERTTAACYGNVSHSG